MHYSSPSSQKDRHRALQRHRSRKRGELQELAAQKEALREEMAAELRAQEELAEMELKQAIIDGSLRVRDIAESIDLVALAASMGGGKSAKRLLADLSLPAVERIRTALMSMDERTSLAAAKIVVDADDTPPLEDRGEPLRVIERKIIDVLPK